ncbi:MAG: sugar ABC transporter ATP-binding protein [Neisseria sp.]|nr:sugar ABC transporter ATP-binding protein [Neisseria sp.]
MSSAALSLKNVSKHFGLFLALDNIELELYRGEVHCLVGENGCGKSTLIKILSGVYTPDKGAQIRLGDDAPRSKITPAQAKAAGIHVIWQDLSLFPHLSVAENIYFHHYVSHALTPPPRRRIKHEAEALMARLGVTLDVETPLSELSIAQRQLVAIAQVISGSAQIIFMDEPTASLTRSEVDHLFSAVRRLQAEGIAIVFVSHRLAEVQEIADRVTVIRDGKRVCTTDADKVSPTQITELMTGTTFSYHTRPATRFEEPVLTLKDWTRRNEFGPLDLTLHRGEIVGLTGLLGSGRTELALSIFGMAQPDAGTLSIDGKICRIRNNRDAINAGIAYVSEDRLNIGLLQEQSIRDNSAISVLKLLDPRGWLLSPRAIEQHSAQWIERLDIKSHFSGLPVSSLSGGNQQRIVLAKWLATQPKVLILDAPTVGVDVGAKAGIFRVIDELAAQGLSILIISDEVSEVYYHCDRVLLMQNGTLSASWQPQHMTLAQMEQAVYG